MMDMIRGIELTDVVKQGSIEESVGGSLSLGGLIVTYRVPSLNTLIKNLINNNNKIRR